MKKRLVFLLGWFPLGAPAALAGFSVVAILLLLINKFDSAIVWPAGLAAAALSAYVVARYYKKIPRPGSKREKIICDLLVVMGVIIWVLFNAQFTAQHLYTNRDPATYAVTGSWLINHNNLHIPKTVVFGGDTHIKTNSAGFGNSVVNPNNLFVQGEHLLPALLGLVGRVVGASKMLHLNVLFGGTALLALYAFARQLARPRWAVIATSTMALTLPLIYFSRDTFTEPLTATFIFSGLALLWAAQSTGKYSLWLSAGLTAGAASLAREDGFLVTAMFCIFSVVYLMLSVRTGFRKASLRALLLLAGLGITGLLGWLDLTKLSDGYYASQYHNVMLELLMVATILITGLLATWLSWRTSLLEWLDKKTRGWLAPAAACLILATAIVLASRPFWYQSHGMQRAVSPTGVGYTISVRDYTEQTVNWVLWYLGPVLAVIGALGLAIGAYLVMKKNQLLLLTSVLTVFAISAFYLYKPRIAPDQIWASRRLLPVIMPGLAAFGALGLEWLDRQRWSRKVFVSGSTLATVLATLAVVGPLFVSYPFLTVRAEGPQLAQITDTCSNLPQKSAVLWVGIARLKAVMPTRTFCDVPSEGVGTYDKAVMAKASRNARWLDYTPVVGIFGNQSSLIPAGYKKDMTTVSSWTFYQLEHTHTRPPRNKVVSHSSVMLGVLQPDGSIKPLKS